MAPQVYVILKNVSKSPPLAFSATMYHDVVCTVRGQCTCKTVQPEGGASKAPPQRRPASFRINPGEESEPLPVEVLHIPQVKTAKKRGLLIEVSRRAQVEVIR